MHSHSASSWFQRVDVQLVLAFLVVALVPAGGVAGLLTWRSAEIADTFVSEHVQQTANAYAGGLDLFLERHRGRLKDVDLGSLDAARMTARVRADRGLVALWSPDRTVSSEQTPAPWAREACDAMRSGRQDFVTHAGEGHAHEVVIVVEQGAEVVCAQVDFTVHQEMMTGQADSALGGSAYIVDQQGVVVCHAFDDAQPHVARGTVLSPEVGRVAGQGRPWSGHVGEGGDRAFAAFATASELPWGVWVEAPRSHAMAPFTTGLVQGLVLAALVALLAAGVAVWWARRLAAPIRSLSSAAERVADGERAVAVPASGPSEVRRLAQRFNAMSATVARAQEDLEARVQARTEELSRARARLVHQEKMAAVGTLAAGLAHEIGNPLASMSSELEMLDIDWDAEDARSAIPVLREQVSRMSRLLHRLVDFGRPASDISGPFEIAPALQEVARLLQHDPRSRDVHISVECPSTIVAASGRDQVMQILVNLGLNALDAAANPGRVLLRGTLAPDGHVQLEVEDDGTGVPAEMASRVFDPFFTTKDTGKGTGLGLFVSERLVRELGGEIEWSTGSMGGARFSVVLPAGSTEASDE